MYLISSECDLNTSVCTSNNYLWHGLVDTLFKHLNYITHYALLAKVSENE